MSVSKPVFINKAEVIALLRARQLADRADWVDRQLPDLIDVDKNSGLLTMLNIDHRELSPVEAVEPPAA
jgi:hypothetical protein